MEGTNVLSTGANDAKTIPVGLRIAVVKILSATYFSPLLVPSWFTESQVNPRTRKTSTDIATTANMFGAPGGTRTHDRQF